MIFDKILDVKCLISLTVSILSDSLNEYYNHKVWTSGFLKPCRLYAYDLQLCFYTSKHAQHKITYLQNPQNTSILHEL